jgi:2,5-diamino-6-(ribosylamino)-4(3H)-pyrimidinone 5'-phosphate reductase
VAGKTLRLYPLPAREWPEGTAVYKDLELPGPDRDNPTRPYLLINMVSSLDGSATAEGKASGIGTAADRQAMRTLRSKADAVMIGAGTLRAERLSLSLDAEDPGSRPLAVILTNTGDVPLENNLIRDERQKVVVLLADSAGETVSGDLRRYAEVLRVRTTSSGTIDLANAIEILKAEHAVDRLLVEGGPSLNHSLISENLADELFITLAPMLLGENEADAPAILNGSLAEPRDLYLLSAYLIRDELFLRYALKTRQDPDTGPMRIPKLPAT